MQEINEFVKNFKSLVKNNDEKAIAVIESVAQYSESIMASQNVINLFFADHGWEHSLRLSHYVSLMIANLKEEKKKSFDDIDWNNMLVLLWTAIALHDIGMNDIAGNADDLMTIIKEQAGRIEHVQKSGEWIEAIIEYINSSDRSNHDIEGFVNAWTNYWDEQHAVDSTTALRMVKDIVLMHGEGEDWLVQGKIGMLDRDVFSDIDEKDKERYIKIISYDEALLCLSDLLDIRKGRMNIFSNPGLNKYFAELDEKKKRLTFEHWVSHNITSVKTDSYQQDGYFVLEMYRYSVDSKMYLNNVLYNMYPRLGAVEACLKWGNDERLKKILEDFGYKGIKQSFCNQRPNVWREINDKAKEFGIYDNAHILMINSKLRGTSNCFINDLVSRWIYENWHVEDNTDFYSEFKSIFHLFSEGASLHLLYDKTKKINEKSIGFFIEMQESAGTTYDINDALLAAINLFFEICNQRRNIHNIRIVSKGNEVFSSLYGGANNDEQTAYIIIIRNYLEDDLNKIIECIKQKNDSSFAVFICTESKMKGEVKQNCQKVQYKINESHLTEIKPLLIEYALKKWSGETESSEKENEQTKELLSEEKIGVGDFLKRLEIIYNGIHAIRENIVADLEKDKYDSLFIINLFEMMSKNISGRREIENEELMFFYNEFYAQNKSEIYTMDDYGVAIATLLSLCEDIGGKVRLREKYSDSFESLIVDSSKEMNYCIKKNLFQMMIFFWLYNYRRVNFKSVCYREYLTYLSPKTLCGYIANPNIDLVERINISFETSEIIVDKLKQNESDSALREFVGQYMNELLTDRNSLLENEDIICFQSIYRIFRGILAPDMEESLHFAIDIIKEAKSHVGYLGFIESACSANLDEDVQLKGIVGPPMKDMLQDIFANSEQNVQYMAYDILYNYKKDDLRQQYLNDLWEHICALLHGESGPVENDINSIYIEWEKMRIKFMDILRRTSESVRKRNMFDDK